jgi:NAD(P)-dependent dehydrogenase (short-subunit alcohol dehydrogenase family)
MMRSLSTLMSLEGRSALVTGGAGHIALAVSQSLVELGARVAVLDLDAGACSRRAAELNELRAGAAIAVPCDLSDEQMTRQAARQAIEHFGGLDILIHCAGYVGTTQLPGWMEPFAGQTVAAWDSAMRVNLTSAFVLVQEVHQALARSGRGSVIFFLSTYGIVAPDFSLYAGTSMGGAAGYGASKGGLLQLMRYLASILAPQVRVNAITPGGVSRGQPEIFQQRYRDRTPLKRMAMEEDFKGAVAYLAGDLSAYVTGHNLVVDGGWTAW